MKLKLLLLTCFVLMSMSFVIKTLPVDTQTKGMVLIQGGTFPMGINSVELKLDMARFSEPAKFFSQEYPAFRVKVVPFYLDKFEVSNAQFKKFVDANPQWAKSEMPDSLRSNDYLKDWKGNNFPKGQANFPVVYVNWYAANAYAHWKNKRLPMEVEWECAAKGANYSFEFPWGNADADVSKANYLQSGTDYPVHVGSYPCNSLGIYDLAGNVRELCLDKWRQDDYAEKASVKSSAFVPRTRQPDDEGKVVVHGGSWNSLPVKLRTTYRESFFATECAKDVGFRCAANVPDSNP
jgi:sulfatase modifying factor 1